MSIPDVVAIEDDLRNINESFYRAFRTRDVLAMEELWARDAPVACVHPGMGVVRGRTEVMRSWKGILQHPNAPVLHTSQVEVHVLGTTAFVTCLAGREGQDPRIVATNIFTMEDGGWRLVHHHAAPLAARKASKPAADEDPFRFN